MLPFALLLLAMAATPIIAPQWWLRHYAKIALGLGAVTTLYYLFGLKDVKVIGDALHEYVSFIALVGSLFIVSGGIHIEVKGGATPLVNTVFLMVGAVLANILGTTGAAMLLIRPWIRLNQHRITAHHIVFFIFIVANAGGCMTPIGDPPLFRFSRRHPVLVGGATLLADVADGRGPVARHFLCDGYDQFPSHIKEGTGALQT